MATLILIPGAMHGGWAWRRVVPLLEQAGHRVIAPDLPGVSRAMPLAPADVTLAGWADYVADLVRQAPGPVVLAGHSRGGTVIGEAAERVADRLAGLIYLAAMIAPPGVSSAELYRYREDRTPPETELLTPAQARAVLYNRCKRADADWATARLLPEPMAQFFTPSAVTWERWGRVPRGYIECTHDVMLPLARQRAMQAAAACAPVLTLDSDHSPFLCAPDALADALIAITATFTADAAD